MDESSELSPEYSSSSDQELEQLAVSSASEGYSETEKEYKEYEIEGRKVRLPSALEQYDLSELLSVDVWTDLLNESDKKELISLLPTDVPVNMTLEELFTKQIFHFSNPIQEFSMKMKKGHYLKRHLKTRNRLFSLYQDDLYRYSSELADAFRKGISEKNHEFARHQYIRRQIGFLQFDSDNSSLDSLQDISAQISDLSESTMIEDQQESYSPQKKEAPKDDEKVREMKQQGNLDWVKHSTRFKDLKIHKNQLTIKMSNHRWTEEYRKQETERYKNPTVPWYYHLEDGTEAVVAAVCKKISSSSVKAREHCFLKSERPSYITILCITRDAAARLPDGVGTRADVCQLARDSQFIVEAISDNQINNLVSGALDRLHYEKDPCVRYDSERKLWIYLHRDRTLDHPAWRTSDAPVKRGRPPVSAFEKQKELLPEYLEDEDLIKKRKS